MRGNGNTVSAFFPKSNTRALIRNYEQKVYVMSVLELDFTLSFGISGMVRRKYHFSELARETSARTGVEWSVCTSGGQDVSWKERG